MSLSGGGLQTGFGRFDASKFRMRQESGALPEARRACSVLTGARDARVEGHQKLTLSLVY